MLLSETEGYWPELRFALEQGRIAGAPVHDARVAAICRDHGVRELWTRAPRFGRFSFTHSPKSARWLTPGSNRAKKSATPMENLGDQEPAIGNLAGREDKILYRRL